MLELLLRASNAESDLRDILWAIANHVKEHHVSTSEWELAKKLNERVVNLNVMMVDIMSLGLRPPVSEKRKLKPLSRNRAKRALRLRADLSKPRMERDTMDLEWSDKDGPKSSQLSSDSEYSISPEHTGSSVTRTTTKPHSPVNVEMSETYLTDNSASWVRDCEIIETNPTVSELPVNPAVPIIDETLLEQSSGLTTANIDTAFDGKIFSVAIRNNGHQSMDGDDFLKSAIRSITTILDRRAKTQRMFTVYTTMVARYARMETHGEAFKTMRFQTTPNYLNGLLDLRSPDWFESNTRQPILLQMSEFQGYTSGWTLNHASEVIFHCAAYSPLVGEGFTELPQWLSHKRAVINVQNTNDDKCFQWAILASLYKLKNPSRISNYLPFVHLLNFTGIEFPVAITDLKRFELQNDISINVFTIEKNETNSECPIVPLYKTQKKRDRHANLLLVHNQLGPDCALYDADSATRLNFHYTAIANISRLLNKQISKSKKTKVICDSCFRHFTPRLFHMHSCQETELGQITMPAEIDNTNLVPFAANQAIKPFVVYVDCVSCFTKYDPSTDGPENEILLSVGYFFRSNIEGRPSYYKSKRSPDCLQWFSEQLKAISDRVYVQLEKPPRWNTHNYNTSLMKACFTCGHDFGKAEKSSLYCQFTGKFKGAVHTKCKFIDVDKQREILVVFHGMSQRIVRQLMLNVNSEIAGPLSIFTADDRLTFCKKVYRLNVIDSKLVTIRFTDSTLWLNSSLGELVSIVPRERAELLRTYLLEPAKLSDEQMRVLSVTRNVLVDSDLMQFDETALPQPFSFQNNDPSEANQMWSMFNLVNRGAFVDLCLKSNVLQLADMFEYFRSLCRQHFDMDATNYESVAELAWNAMFRITKAKLMLMTDMDQVLFVERGLRGGIAHSSQDATLANHPDMGDAFNPYQPTGYLMHLRANDLYGQAMTEYLPTASFEWHPNPADLDVLTIPDNHSEGYILEVDLEYPEHLHDSHSDFPLCAEQSTIPGTAQPKLTMSLTNKSNYVLHYRTLKTALTNGLILKKIHKCLKFQQSPWMQPFVELIMKTRIDAANAFEKKFADIMLPSVYAKLQENPRRRSRITMPTDWPGRFGVKYMLSSPYLESRIILDPSNVAVELRSHEIVYNSPIIIGMAVQEMAKCLVDDFHYEFMKSHGSGEEIRMLYTDIDTFVYHIGDQVVYEAIQTHLNEYKSKPYLKHFQQIHSPRDIVEFVGTRPKWFCIRTVNRDDALTNN